MKVDITPAKILTILGIPAAVVAAITAWNVIGWETPAAHNGDIVQIETEHEAVNSAILIQLKANRDEWWCDEESEYLDDLIAMQDAGDTSSWVEQEVLEQRQKMERVACDRFDKD